jgi:hypothetical protein
MNNLFVDQGNLALRADPSVIESLADPSHGAHATQAGPTDATTSAAGGDPAQETDPASEAPDGPSTFAGPAPVPPETIPPQQPGSAGMPGPPPQVIYVLAPSVEIRTSRPPVRTPVTWSSPAERTPLHRLSEFTLVLAQATLALLLLGQGTSDPLHFAVDLGVMALVTARVAHRRAGLRGQDGGIRRRPPPSRALCSRRRPSRAIRTSWACWAQPVLDGIVDVADGLLTFLNELFEQLE